MEAARTLAGSEVALERIEALKFKSLLRPGEVIHAASRAVGGPPAALPHRQRAHRSSSGCCVLAAGPAGGA